MKFLLGNKRGEESFSVIYRKEEYSFDVEPALESGYASIMINWEDATKRKTLTGPFNIFINLILKLAL